MSINYDTFYGYQSLICPVCGTICRTEFVVPARAHFIECVDCGMRYEIKADRIRETYEARTKIYTVWHEWKTANGRKLSYRDKVFKTEDEAKQYVKERTKRVAEGRYYVEEEEVRE